MWVSPLTIAEKIVLKLGGSVITVKDKPFTPRIDAIKDIAHQLRGLTHEKYIELTGIVLGGGSYGHFTANKFYEEKSSPCHEAIYQVTTSMIELALLVSEILAMYNLYTAIFPPHSFCRPKGIRPLCRWDYIYPFLSRNVIPLTFGDIYPCNSEQGFCIVSGDELALEIACSTSATSVVYVTDVDGIYDSKMNLIKKINVDSLGKIIHRTEEKMGGVDVTGGMKRKLTAINEIKCPTLRRIIIVNGLKRGFLYKVLKNEDVPSTLIEL